MKGEIVPAVLHVILPTIPAVSEAGITIYLSLVPQSRRCILKLQSYKYMKKALVTVSAIALGIMHAAAQNGGAVIIGQQAQANSQVGGSLINLIQLVQNIVARLVPLGIGLAVVALFFGIIMFLVKGRDDEKQRKNWLAWMGYSILGLFVMVAIWGLVGFISSVLGVGLGGSAPTPTIPYAQ